MNGTIYNENAACHTQEAVVEQISRERTKVNSRIPWLNIFLSSVPENYVELKTFANRADLAHPELDCHLSEKDWTELKDAVENGKAISKIPMVRPRTCADREQREKLRAAKSNFVSINMRHVYILGENGFRGRFVDFDRLVRYATIPEEMVGKMNKQQHDFNTLGLSEMANVVKRKLELMKALDGDLWQGFHRLKPSDAATILALMHGMSWHDMMYVVIPSNAIPKDFFVPYDPIESIPEVDPIKKSITIKDRKLGNFDYLSFSYQPRLYPLHAFPDHPQKVREIINRVESLPDINGRPAFDYYWVLVPGVGMNHPVIKHPDGIYRLNIGAVKEFKNDADAAKALDIALVKDRIILPCVLGEREGQCYFLSLFM